MGIDTPSAERQGLGSHRPSDIRQMTLPFTPQERFRHVEGPFDLVWCPPSAAAPADIQTSARRRTGWRRVRDVVRDTPSRLSDLLNELRVAAEPAWRQTCRPPRSVPSLGLNRYGGRCGITLPAL